jgi:hypothetical protein
MSMQIASTGQLHRGDMVEKWATQVVYDAASDQLTTACNYVATLKTIGVDIGITLPTLPQCRQRLQDMIAFAQIGMSAVGQK